MAKFDPYTNEEIVSPEDDAIQETETPEDEEEDHWFFKHFQYGPINWWI
ncbi:hypothetical protein [Gordoniibacillus kamchatkensis]|nr:hypothetical protein [Paenibacillus sp. VKM B-2647]